MGHTIIEREAGDVHNVNCQKCGLHCWTKHTKMVDNSVTALTGVVMTNILGLSVVEFHLSEVTSFCPMDTGHALQK